MGSIATAPRQLERAERDEILHLMGPVKRSGEWLMGFCPAHADGEKHGHKGGQSLGLSDTGVLRCFAGCAFSDVIEALRARAGIRRYQPRPSQPASTAKRADDTMPWRQVAVYDYGIAQHVRLEADAPESSKGYKKRFAWRISENDPRTLKQAGLTEDDLPLYGLQSLTDLAPGRWVHFAEGEKMVDALHARNEPAVCAGGGASQQSFGDALAALRGLRVRIWPDNDPPGLQYAARVKRQLQAIGAEKVVIMPAVGGAGDDLVNFFDAGGKLETLLSEIPETDAVEYVADDHLRVRLHTDAGEVIADAAALVESPRDLNTELTVTWNSQLAELPYTQHVNLYSASGREGLARVLGKHFPESNLNWTAILNRAVAAIRKAVLAIDISELVEPDPDAPPAPMIVTGYIVAGGGSILYGLPKRGKSQAALALAVTVDAGLNDGIFRLQQQVPVLYVNLERSRQSMLARLARLNVALGLDPRRPLRFIHARGASFATILSKVRRTVAQHRIGLVVLDSISRGGFGDLNANQVANAAVDALNSLGVAWLAIGHSPRPRDGDTAQPHLYGSIHQDAGADVMIALSSKADGQEKLLVSLAVTDANDFGRPPTLDLVYEFDSDGMIGIRHARADELVELEEVKTLTLGDQIIASLRDEGQAKSIEIAKRIGKHQSNIVRELGRLAEKGLVERTSDGVWNLSGGQLSQPLSCALSDNYHDKSGSLSNYRYHPPLRGDNDNDKAGDSTVVCSVCHRDGMGLAGYHPDSTANNELPVCATCLDDIISRRGA